MKVATHRLKFCCLFLMQKELSQRRFRAEKEKHMGFTTMEKREGGREAEVGKVFGSTRNVSEQVSLWAKCN